MPLNRSMPQQPEQGIVGERCLDAWAAEHDKVASRKLIKESGPRRAVETKSKLSQQSKRRQPAQQEGNDANPIIRGLKTQQMKQEDFKGVAGVDGIGLGRERL